MGMGGRGRARGREEDTMVPCCPPSSGMLGKPRSAVVGREICAGAVGTADRLATGNEEEAADMVTLAVRALGSKSPTGRLFQSHTSGRCVVAEA